jgi:hypothetical protein
MKQRTKELAIKWLETAKSTDTFVINTVHHSKHEVEKLLGIKPSKKHKEQINIDIQEEEHADMGETHPTGSAEEHGTGDSQSTE